MTKSKKLTLQSTEWQQRLQSPNDFGKAQQTGYRAIAIAFTQWLVRLAG
jgi:hypothetical protein